MRKITSLIAEDREFGASIDAVLTELGKAEPAPIAVNGLSGGASYAYITEMVASLYKKTGAPILVLAEDAAERDKILGILASSGVRALAYKSREFVFHNISASHDNERERLSVLRAILEGEVDAVVATPDAAVGATVPPDMLAKLVMKLKISSEISPIELADRLATMGFASCDLASSAGQYARRGGIVDFFVNAADAPVRVEFFGDEIDRIVSYDPITQRSVASLGEAAINPAIEVMLDKAARERVMKEASSLLKSAKSENTKNILKREIAFLEEGITLDSRDKYLGLIYEERSSLISYFSSVGRCPVIIVGTAECNAALKRYYDSLKENASALIAEGLISEKCVGYAISSEEYDKFLASTAVIHINSFSGVSGLGRLGGIFGFRTRRTVSYGGNGNERMLKEDIDSLLSGGYRVIIISENRQGVESLARFLDDSGYTVSADAEAKELLSSRRGILITQGDFDGFDLISARIALLSMREDEGKRIMAQRRRQRILKKVGGAGQRIMSYADLEVGDYVVHANYGIGLFEGMESVRIDGVTRDYITIKYAGTDKLFVPCDRLEMIGKYIGARENDGSVKLSKMGGGDWNKAKTRAKAAVKEIADKLIKIYAERQRTPGFAFPADSELEDEFASDFEYTETESQAMAIEEIKRDMMKPVPMNRLLCGDVGFGKTEVALRAAFKAIMGGKQVAILVPTTILALQHYQTAMTRMRGYPVSVDMISRFRTPREQARIAERTAEGKIDILIGTHKLLGSKISFKNLGLLIIDEEQRFGVAQKEKLKEMSTNIDVLTLSATPIPRTLNMAINGISDMSVLDEAPENRRPVQTYVLEHDEAVIYDAIRRELHRQGQVLYLFNNIDTISFTADKIATAIPEARVAYAHGRMEKEELEDIWQSLVNGEIDVLVCTTIIETGVDLPAANTLIIENADKMGLSQLHQIRGRVGRSERQAYAYFTYRPGKALTDIARKRLSAIREYAEFGAGFKIALCDLEIRGAGNILGAEQHGYIDSVGYDLYVKLLSEAVLEQKGESTPTLFESVIDFKVDAHIPEYYIASSALRMEIYKKISHIRTPEDMSEVLDELLDRFGEPPKSTERLLRIALARAVAEEARIPRVELKGGSILFYTDKPDLSIWSMILAKHRGKLIGSQGPAPIIYRLKIGEDPVAVLSDIFDDYYAELHPKDSSEKG